MGMVFEKERVWLTDQLGYEGIFDEFCNIFLKELEVELDKIEQAKNISLNTNIRKDILYYAKSTLIELSSRIMIFELNHSDQNYDEFCNYICENPNDIYQKYPVLYSKIKRKINSIKHNILEIYNALYECKEDIKRIFGLNIQDLKSINPGQGDTHNDGRTVAILIFDNNSRIVYKPRNMYPELVFSKSCEMMNSWFDNYELVYPKLIARDSYGFQEFVESDECKTNEEVKNYYHRIGRALGLFYIMDTTDIHGENIIPFGEYPVFIDLESLTMVPRKKTNTSKDSLVYNVNKVYEHSVFTSNLLPCTFKGGILDVDISGLGATAGQKSKKLKCLQLVEKGTDNIHFDEEYYITEEMENAVKLNGKHINYSDYLIDIERGFAEAYEMLFSHKEYLINNMPELFKRGKYRQILRGTFVYVRFLKASLHPKYCTSSARTKELLQIISSNNNSQFKSEVEQMLNHDVPYFYAKCNDTALYEDKSLVEKDFFEKTICEKLVQNIKDLSIEDMKRQIAFIHNSIRIAQKDIMNTDIAYPDFIIDKKENIDIVKAVISEIRKYAIWDANYKSCTFIDVNIDEQPSIGGIPYTLYDGMGMILFLFAYARYTNDKKDIMFAEASLRGMEEVAPLEKAALSSSVFGGFYGYIYLYFNLYRMTGNTEYYDKYIKAINRIYDYDVTSEGNIDVIAGVSGAVIVLANIYNLEKDKRLCMLINRYCDFMQHYISRSNIFWTGFSHGYAGFQYAFMKAFEATQNVKYLHIAHLLEQKEDIYYESKKANWIDLRDNKHNCCSYWCHGAPGILLARSYYMDPKVFDRKYKKVINTIIDSLQINDRDTFNDCLCHGRVGNIDVLREIAINTNNKELMEKVHKFSVDEEESIKKYGIIYGIPQLKGSMSFMLGLPGIGYGYLRNKTKGLPMVLALEVL